MSSPNITGNRASNVSPGYGGDYGNYGDTGNSMGPQDPGVQQQVQMYYQYAQMYQQVIAQGGPQAAQAQQYLQMVNGYLTQLGAAPVQDMMGQMGSEWDPTAQNQAQNVAMQFGGATPDYQDSSHIVFEKGSGSNITVDRNDSETKQVDVYTGDNALFIPSNAASVSFATADDTGAPGHKMITATITFPNGATRTVVYHKVDRENFALQIKAADPSNVALDGVTGFTDKVTVSGLDEENTETLGDPPTRMEGGARVYDGQSFNIAPVASGSNKKTEVMASGDVSITPNSNSEYYSMEYVATDPAHYEIKVYNSLEDKTAGKVKETITVDAQLIDHINLGMDPSRMEFGASLKGTDAHSIDGSKPGADKIAFGEAEATTTTEAVNKNHPEDTPPSQVENQIATYDDSADVSLTNYFDGKVNTYDITASGTVTINANKQSDKFLVSYDSTNKIFTITVTGKDSKGVSKTIVYRVNADQVDKIHFGNIDPAQVVIGNDITDALKAKLQVGDVTTEASDTENSATSILDNLKSISGKTENQIVNALKQAGFSIADINDLKAKMSATPPQFPPAFSSSPGSDFEKLIKALYALDGQVSGPITGMPWEANAISSAFKQASPRLVSLLQALYPDHNISVSEPNAAADKWTRSNNITFDGVMFNWCSQKRSKLGQIEVTPTTYGGTSDENGVDHQ